MKSVFIWYELSSYFDCFYTFWIAATSFVSQQDWLDIMRMGVQNKLALYLFSSK